MKTPRLLVCVIVMSYVAMTQTENVADYEG